MMFHLECRLPGVEKRSLSASVPFSEGYIFARKAKPTLKLLAFGHEEHDLVASMLILPSTGMYDSSNAMSNVRMWLQCMMRVRSPEVSV